MNPKLKILIGVLFLGILISLGLISYFDKKCMDSDEQCAGKADGTSCTSAVWCDLFGRVCGGQSCVGLGMGVCASNRCIPEGVVSITTDKTEYKQRETVKIAVGNSTDEEKKICSPFYTVENFDGEKWIEIRKVLCPCDLVCKLAAYTVLQPNKSTTYEWNQREEWCSESTKRSTTISNQVPAGRYRIKSYIGAVGAECKEIYSNDFTVE